MTNYKEEYQHWLDSPALSEEEWKELNSISGDEKEIESRFFAPLEFGTAGLRGTMKLGLHNMNIHIIRHATQAFANVILEEGMDAAERGIAIAHDCRINSRRFAEEAACVMAANGIRVRLFESLRPTPELSFAVLHYGTAIRSTGPTGRSSRRRRLRPLQSRWKPLTCSRASRPAITTKP